MQSSEARADFWLRAEAEAEAKGGGGALREARSSRLAARGSMLQQREVVHCCCACPHALAPGGSGSPKGRPKEASKTAKEAGTRSAFGRSAAEKRLPAKLKLAAHRSAMLPCPALPRPASPRPTSPCLDSSTPSIIRVRLVQTPRHAGLSGDPPSLFRRSNKRNPSQIGVLATRHRKPLAH
jgi:hypothetical protein